MSVKKRISPGWSTPVFLRGGVVVVVVVVETYLVGVGVTDGVSGRVIDFWRRQRVFGRHCRVRPPTLPPALPNPSPPPSHSRTKGERDLGIAPRLALPAHRRVEVAPQEAPQVPSPCPGSGGRGVRKEEPLRLAGAARVDGELVFFFGGGGIELVVCFVGGG